MRNRLDDTSLRTSLLVKWITDIWRAILSGHRISN